MKSIYLTAFSLLIAFSSCEPPKNEPPQIIELICSDDDRTIYGGDQIIFECVASDPENDNIIYKWSASTGTFTSNTSSSTVVWKSPTVTMESIAKILVQVTDAEHDGNPATNPDGEVCWINLDPIPEPEPEPDPTPEPVYVLKYVIDDTFPVFVTPSGVIL